MRNFEMELLAGDPPSIVRGEPRYQQELLLRNPHQAATAPRPPMPIWHLDGVHWYKAPAPPRRHKHWAQTVGCLRLGDEMWRCPCGAIGEPARPGRDGWINWIHLDKPRVAAAPARRRWWQREQG